MSDASEILESLFECGWSCGFLTSRPPSVERCNRCGKESDCFGEFCACGHQDFSFVCPECNGYVVVDHPDTIGPRRPRAFVDDGGAR